MFAFCYLRVCMNEFVFLSFFPYDKMSNETEHSMKTNLSATQIIHTFTVNQVKPKK